MARRFTRKEIEVRNRKEDAVIVIDNVVYDVTAFLEEHPGGAQVLLHDAGGDASRCFRDVGHSEDARLRRRRFEIGEVVDEDRRDVALPQPSSAECEHRLTFSGLIDIMVPPLAIGAVAVLAYLYVFP